MGWDRGGKGRAPRFCEPEVADCLSERLSILVRADCQLIELAPPKLRATAVGAVCAAIDALIAHFWLPTAEPAATISSLMTSALPAGVSGH